MSAPACIQTKVLVGIVILQWICISHLLLRELSYDALVGSGGEHGPAAVAVPPLPPPKKAIATQQLEGSATERSSSKPHFKGVATTVMLNNPKWFQRRYTMMIQNVLFNIPPDWGVQIFYTGTGQSQFGIDISPGLTRLIDNYPDRIALTTIPPSIAKSNKKPKQLWTTEWIWENMMLSNDTARDNQNVLTFAGNGAICSNSRTTMNDIIEMRLDFIGMPTNRNKGLGGDGSTHSLRNRKAMLDALQYQKEAGNRHNGEEREDIYFLRTLMEMNKNGKGDIRYQIATKEQTELLGGITPTISKMAADEWNNDSMKKEAENAGPPMIVSGTIPQLGNAARELMLDLCPELKIIFPSELMCTERK
ncbi:hypothetical protein ACHAWF_004713 [Thalassiosira exigua]